MGDNFALGFVFGFVAGVIVAGVVGFVYFRIRWHLGRVKAIRRSQTIQSDTGRTPWQVLVDGCVSLVRLIIFVVVVIFLLAVALVFGQDKIMPFVRSFTQP